MFFHKSQFYSFLIFVIVVGCYSHDTNTTGIRSKIISEERGSMIEFPSSAAMYYWDLHLCGAEIISDYYLVTAAHCLYGIPKQEYLNNVFIIFGIDSLSQIRNIEEIREINDVIIHPEYNNGKGNNDICIVKVDQAIVFYHGIPRQAKLYDSVVKNGAEVNISGWGFYDPKHKKKVQSEYLRKTTFTFVPRKPCRLLFGLRLLTIRPPQDIFCGISGIKNIACMGDSGSGAYYQGKLIGIVSRGTCSNSKLAFGQKSKIFKPLSFTIFTDLLAPNIRNFILPYMKNTYVNPFR